MSGKVARAAANAAAVVAALAFMGFSLFGFAWAATAVASGFGPLAAAAFGLAALFVLVFAVGLGVEFTS